MLNYRKGTNEMEEPNRDDIPIENLPANFLWMHVKGGTKVTNVVPHARKAFEAGEHRAVVWTGCGSGGVGKSISCAEIFKRDQPNMYQVTRLCYQKSNEFWEPIEAGLDRIVASRQTPCIHILQSLDEVDPSTPGYQVGQTEFWEQTDENRTKNSRPKKRHPIKK